MISRTIIAVAVLAVLMDLARAEEQTIGVAEDTWIHGLTSASVSGGSDEDLGICPIADYWIYLKFDVSGIAGEITAAELRMNRFAGARPEEIALYSITDDSWREGTLSGVTRPEPTDPAPELMLAAGREVGDHDAWTAAAFVDLVGQESALDGTLSLMLREAHSARADARRYLSREGDDTGKAPRLVITVEPAAPAEELDAGWNVVTIGSGTKPSFDFGPDGRVHVMAMTEKHDGEVWHAVAASPAGPWAPTNIATGYFYGPGDIRVDTPGTAHIAWHNHDLADPVHATVDLDGTVTTYPLSTPGHDGWDNALALDGTGTLHQTSIDPLGFGAVTSLEHGTFDGDVWTFAPVAISGPAMYGLATSIAIDRQDDLHIVYCMAEGWTTPGELKYLVQRDGEWEISTIVSGDARGRFPSIAVDHWDRPHVVWIDIEPTDESHALVRYAVLDNDTWAIETVVELDSVVMGFSNARKSVSLVLDGSWRPHVAFADTRTVGHATKPLGDWEITTVLRRQEALYKGLVVMRLDARGNPAIVFWEEDDDSDGLVRLASKKEGLRPEFHRGDPNESGVMDIADGIFVFGYLFLGGVIPSCLESADANNDGAVDISDGSSILNFLFLGGPPPDVPGPGPAPCGTDPDTPGSARDIGCASYEGC